MGLVTNGTLSSKTEIPRPLNGHFPNFFVNGKRPMSVVLSESDIPGSSLNGRNPSELKNDELRFWLKRRDDPGKGLRTKAEFLSGKLLLYCSIDAST